MDTAPRSSRWRHFGSINPFCRNRSLFYWAVNFGAGRQLLAAMTAGMPLGASQALDEDDIVPSQNIPNRSRQITESTSYPETPP